MREVPHCALSHERPQRYFFSVSRQIVLNGTIYERLSRRRWRPESSVRLLSQDAIFGSHQGRHQARSRATHPPPAAGREEVMFDPDAGMPRINRGMVYLGACLIAGIRLARERQVNVRVIPTRAAIRVPGKGSCPEPMKCVYLLASPPKLSAVA